MQKLKKEIKGITLVALVVTIIVLLILAGIAINLTVGNNGLFGRAQNAEKEYDKASIKEELELIIGEVQIDNLMEEKGIISEETEKALKENGAIVIDRAEDIIEGEYKNYGYTIDEKGNVTVGEKITGDKPTAEIKITPIEEDGEIVGAQIQVLAHSTDGDIESIETLDGLELKTQNSNADKIFETSKNGKYRFKIRGTNKRLTIIETEEITDIIPTIEAESILAGVSKINMSGRVNIKVDGKTTYKVNSIRIEGDVALGEKLLVNGEEQTIEDITHSGSIYSVGNEKDVGAANQYAKHTVVLKVEGNLTINENIKLTAIASSTGYGGPKGMIIYCTENLNNNGEISMTARGAYAKGEDVYLWKNQSNTSYEYVPAVGANGGAGVYKLAGGRSGSNADTITETSRATRRRRIWRIKTRKF